LSDVALLKRPPATWCGALYIICSLTLLPSPNVFSFFDVFLSSFHYLSLGVLIGPPPSLPVAFSFFLVQASSPTDTPTCFPFKSPQIPNGVFFTFPHSLPTKQLDLGPCRYFLNLSRFFSRNVNHFNSGASGPPCLKLGTRYALATSHPCESSFAQDLR